MDSWEKTAYAGFKKKRKKAAASRCNEKQWGVVVRKKKENAEKAFYRFVQTSPLSMPREKAEWDKEIYGKDAADKPDSVCEECKAQPKIMEKIHCSDKISSQSSVQKAAISGVPPLCECAKKFIEKVKLICIENKLYYFDSPCYKALDRTKLVQLYRDNVDRNLHGARNVKSFYELYSYLLTDSALQIELNQGRQSKLAILKNGIYNLKKGRLEPFDPSIIAFSYVDAAYTEDMECPRFEKFLCDVTGNSSILIERLWKFLGYIFTQSLDAKAFFVMGCAPNSGKSLLGKFIMKLYEPQYVSSIALSEFNGDFSLGTLVGAAVNVSLDLPSSKLSTAAVSKLKMLTGGDLITINEKYVPQFKYQNRAKFIFASNHPIELMEDDEAFWERLVFLPFDYSVSKLEQDMDLLKKLLKEKDAVVSKALQYARELMLDNYKFPTTEGIERQVRKWRGIEIDTINDFIMERCQVGEPFKGETMERLYEAYEVFCREKGEKAQSWKEMKTYLQNRIGLQHTKVRMEKGENPRSAFRGISLYS